MENLLKYETSPYLLQHAKNPVDWYPWGEDAFQKAKKEDKPVFLSIGYSTCHWCHVMAHESFENLQVADILNDKFIAIKVDKEERPDIDSTYMKVCQMLTGSGGWPLSIFLTPEQKPFYAGTYFPRDSQRGMTGFLDLLSAIAVQWEKNRTNITESAEIILSYLHQKEDVPEISEDAFIFETAFSQYLESFDSRYGGFGSAPKFPSLQNYLFLLEYHRVYQEEMALEMVKKSLIQMYKGGIFDHIGFGFSRYSTDPWFLIPHFEKMLYDNALFLLTYAKVFMVTKAPIFLEIAEKTAVYLLRDMTGPEGEFYSAQDADSQGEEGKYYTFGYHEVEKILGTKAADAFRSCYGISPGGNFEGKNLPNLLHQTKIFTMDQYLSKLYEYRKNRYSLHRDDKILTAWNAMAIAAFAFLYRVSKKTEYLQAAKNTDRFVRDHLSDGKQLFVCCRKNKTSGMGFLDDYAWYIYALLGLYEATLEKDYLQRAMKFLEAANEDYFDQKNGGYFLYGKRNEKLVLRTKEIYDGAIPCGNSVMGYNLIKLFQLTGKDPEGILEKQQRFLSGHIKTSYMGSAFFMTALLMKQEPPQTITVVLGNETAEEVREALPVNANIIVMEHPTKEYPLLNSKTTFYVCRDHQCFPPMNQLNL